jgi:PAS domain S-box-containing protein
VSDVIEGSAPNDAVGSFRLLLIEDSDDDAWLLERALSRAALPFTIVRVETKAELRRALDQDRFDAIVSDHSLPTFGAPRALAVHAELGLDVPFVVVSGEVGEEVAVGLLRAGARDFVSKQQLERLPEVLRREVRESARRAELRGAERALAHEREMAARYLTIVPTLVLATDAAGRITLVNEGGQRLLEGKSAELLGRSVFEFLGEADPSIGEALLGAFDEVMRGARTTMPDAEVTVRTLREQRRRIRCRMVPVRDTSGAPTGAVWAAEDLTERQSLEESLRRAQKLDALGRLAAATAHDFNNVLTVILATAELARHSEPGDWAELAQTIVEASMRGAELTKQLLASARHQPAERKPLDLAVAVEPTTKMIRRLLGERVRLRAELAAGVRIVGDAGQIDQVVMNLVLNARDAMPDGGELVLTVTRESVDAAVAAAHGRPGGAYAVLRVRDTGQGIGEADLARIFDPFFTTKQPGHGTGIGLATVASIVDKHGGFITVHSALGVGTTFALHFPETAAEPIASERTIDRPARRATVLVLDDVLPVRRAVARVLRSEGFQVLKAASFDEALAALRDHPDIGVLVADVGMGSVQSGLQVLHAIRSQRPRFPAVLMSADAGVLYGHEAEHTVALRKPFQYDALLAAVLQAMGDTIE